MSNYINDLRQKVGNAPLILNTATGALFNNAGEVLLQERVDTKDWGFPGGYLEYGETYKKAIVREFQEDTGLSVIPEKLIQNTDDTFYKYPNGDQIQSINQFFLVRYLEGTLLSVKTGETTRLKYFKLDQPPQFFNEQHAEMFKKIQRMRE